MSDDVDDLTTALRRAMASLDRQVPSGYFEALPDRTLARLDDPSIEALDAREDSGRHDLRELASETRAQGSLPPDEVAASSASWKAVAVPEPSEREVRPRTQDGPARSAIGGAAAARRVGDPAASRGGASRWRIAAIAGLGVAAAAAGAVMFLGRDRPAVPDAAHARSVVTSSAPSAPSVERLEQAPTGAPSAGGASSTAAPAGTSRPTANAASEDARDRATDAPRTPGKPAPDPKGKRMSKTAVAQKPEVQGQLPGVGSASAQSVDHLATSKGKPVAPRPDRTSLSADDIERGMTAVAGKAQACFAGTQGPASLRLTVAPTGRVVTATATGPFAGTAVGACVERAARDATFPPWHGEPQSFGYSYRLAN
jgi:hypothetical protein